MYDADPPNYNASSYHPPGSAHHAARASQFSPSTDGVFRPINQSYMIQSPHEQPTESYPFGSRDRNLASK